MPASVPRVGVLFAHAARSVYGRQAGRHPGNGRWRAKEERGLTEDNRGFSSVSGRRERVIVWWCWRDGNGIAGFAGRSRCYCVVARWSLRWDEGHGRTCHTFAPQQPAASEADPQEF